MLESLLFYLTLLLIQLLLLMLQCLIFLYHNLFCFCFCFFTILLISAFSNTVNAELAAKSLILGICFIRKSSCIRNFQSASLIFFSKSHLLVVYLVFKTNLLVSILFTFEANLLYTVLRQLHDLLYYLAYLNNQEQFLTCLHLFYLFQLLKQLNQT